MARPPRRAVGRLWIRRSPGAATAPRRKASQRAGSTAIAVLPARWLAFRLGAVAAPGERRIHSRPTARLGGLAMYLGFGLSAALFSTNPSTLGLLLSAAVVTTLMVLDDLNGVRALSKLDF